MDVGSPRTVTLSDRLRHAASKGNVEDVAQCLQAGASYEPDQDGRTALHYAALNGYTDVTKFLLEKGCNYNVQDASGYTALHRAASQGHVEVITALLEKGCDVNTQDEHGNAAIHEAAWNGFSKTLELLIKYNVDVSVVNKAGFTALHLAAQNGHNESSRVLLYASCNSDLKNNYGDTTLHTGARYGHAGVTRILISARAKINEQNKNGDTALHIAAALKRRKIAKLLVESGTDVFIKNKQNETAVDVARRKDHGEIIVIIQAYCRPSKPPVKEVNFKTSVQHMEGPVVVPDRDMPDKRDKADKGKRFLFFKKRKPKEKEKTTPHRGMVAQKVVHGHRCQADHGPVQGFFSKYVPRQGVQYYRDLAGNVKQGPVGYTPTCNCLPAIHRLEKQVHDTQDHVNGQIQSTNRVMQEQMHQMDQRSSMRVQALEKYTQDRFTEEETLCRQRINQKYSEHDNYYAPQGEHMKSQIQNWLEQKLEGYGHCLHHHHDDSALPNENIFSDVHETANGRLFKSRSDETLSQSDNHSGRFRKREFYESRTEAMQQIRAWQVPSYSKDRSRVKVLEKQNRNSLEALNRPQSRQEVNVEPEQVRRYPVEPKIEVRNRPQSQNERTQNKTDDDRTYMTMSGSHSQGAIAKHSAVPQAQVYPNARKGSVSRGPVTHSSPKSRESSPYTTHSGILHSQVDDIINRNVPNSNSWQQEFDRTDSSLEPKKQISISENSVNDRACVFSSAITQHPDKADSGANLVTPPSNRHSICSEKFVPDVPKPTFSTFGYDDGHDGRNAPSNSPEQNAKGTFDEMPNFNTPRPYTSANSGKDELMNRTLLAQSLFSRQNSQGSYGFIPRNGDDMYVEMKNLSPGVHQRVRSSEGLLETDIDHVNFNRSHSEERTLEVQIPNTSRSSSETRENLQMKSMRNTLNSNSVPQQVRISSQHQQQSSISHPLHSSTPYMVQSGGNRSGAGPPTLPKPSVQSPPYAYATVRDVQHGSDVRYNGNLSTVNRNTTSDNLYSSVGDVQLKSDHNLAVADNAVNGTKNNLKQNQLEPRSKTAYQTYLTENPNFSSDNIYHRENSPNVCNNSKEDSSSNPDSGYSSKIYGNRVNSATLPSLGTTPSSSFSTDRGVPSNTNSPQSQYSNADYEHLPMKQYDDEVQNHVQSWYQRKLQETTQKVYDSWRSERSPGTVTPQKQQQNGCQRLPVRYYGNSDYAKIDYNSANGRQQNGLPLQTPYIPPGQMSHLVSTFVVQGSDV